MKWFNKLFPSPEQQREIRRKKLNVRLARSQAKYEFYARAYNGTASIYLSELDKLSSLAADIAGIKKELTQL